MKKRKDISHLVWDWNGTMFDDVSACVQSINVMLERRRAPQISTNQYIGIFGFPVQNYYKALGFDFSVEDWDAVAREYHDIYREKSATSPLRRGLVGVLERVRAAGVPMSILSACELSILDNLLDRFGIRGFFDSVCGLSNLHATSKLELGRELVGRIGFEPARVLLVGDTVHDYEVASALGFECVLVAGGHQAEHRLKRCNCAVLDDISELLGFF